MRLKNAFTLLAFMIVLTGCASLGAEKPQNFNDKLAYAQATQTAVLATAKNGVVNGSLSKDDAKAVEQISDNAQTIMDAAQAVVATDPSTANAKLLQAITLLEQAQNYLNSHGKQT